jgi:ATP-dependent Clp protease adaptor protein ClpS
MRAPHAGPTTLPAQKPAPARRPGTADDARPQFEPLYNVVLIDDDEHTYQYVITMLCTILEIGFEMAYMMACAVDAEGRVIVHTTDRDTAELERDQIRAFGPDPLLPGSRGSMHAVVEPLPAA